MVSHVRPPILRLITRLRRQGRTQQEIAEISGVSQGGVSKILRRARETGLPTQRPLGHRQRLTTAREDRCILRLARMNRFWPASRISIELRRRTGCRVSNRTIRRRLLVAGYRARRPNRCPRLTLAHRRRRRAWGRRHENWTIQHWSHVIFSDESKFNLFFADGRLRVRRREGERLIDVCVQPGAPRVGPSVMVWGAFHAGGKSDLVFIEGGLNQYRYMDILRRHLLPWARAQFQANFVLVQDNAPPHRAHNTGNFLRNQDVEVMDWPALSPDMNPIEHIWDRMGRVIRDMDNPPLNVADLRDALRHAWAAIPDDALATLSGGMPRRVAAVNAARGGHTRY